MSILDDVLALRAQEGSTMVGAAKREHYQWTHEDYAAQIQAARAIGARSAADLLLVEWSESRLEPWAEFPGGVAVGLIQITPTAAKAMGISEAERRSISSLTPAAQAPYVVKYFTAVAGKRTYEDAGAIYQAIAAPGTLGKGSANSVVCYPAGSAAYAANPGLDANGDGEITVGDLRAHLASIAPQSGYQRALAELRGVDPTQTLDIGGGFVAGSQPAPIVPPAAKSSAGGDGGGGVILLALLGLLGKIGLR